MAAPKQTVTSSNQSEPSEIPQPIDRPRLLEKIETSPARIVALIAPAGYGKTTLARQWTSGREAATYAWYSVGAEGFDVAAVAARIAAAVSTLVPGADERMLARLAVSNDPEGEAVLLAEMLSRSLTAWPPAARLAIDDYQSLSVSHACERFVETLVSETPIRLLITSRKRPAWAHSRLRLYGDLLEIRRDELEMTPDEARRALAPISDDEQRAELVEICHGWPAVLGLAARSQGAALPKDALLPDLYDYFAEEMFQSADANLQRLLCQISAAPYLSKDLLERLGGRPALDLADAAERRGFFHTPANTDERSLHPLLRTFLQQRLDDRPDRSQLVDELVDVLLERERWDDVWQLIQYRDRPDLLPRLIECSLPTLLDGSRVPSLESWIEFGRERGLESPLIDLAEAEVAFVAGEHSRAFATAVQAAHRFNPSSPVLWRAFAIAARSARFSDRLTDGLEFSRKARSRASESGYLHCLWTEFLCAYELESEALSSIFREMVERQDGSPDTTIRLMHAKVMLSAFPEFPMPEDGLLEFTLPLLNRVHPQLSSSFLGHYCNYLTQFARYTEAEALIDDVFSILIDYDLSLAIPPMCCLHACNAIGLRRYRHTELLLDAAEQASHSRTGSIPMQARALREILSLLRAKGEIDLSPISIDPKSAKLWRGLGYAVDALKWACQGDRSTSLTWAEKADDITKSAEVRSLTAFTRVITVTQSSTVNPLSSLRDAITFAETRHQWNQFVWAYRAYPQLLSLIASSPDLVLRVQPVLSAARDEELARRHGIHVTEVDTRADSQQVLSRREQDVLRLIADGLSNKEIGQKLFISEVTVKVHLRHIYRKLNVRNRTEAARYALYSD